VPPGTDFAAAGVKPARCSMSACWYLRSLRGDDAMRYFLLLVLFLPLPASAQSEWVTGSATPVEVYQKVTAAAQFLAESGQAGLKEFEKTNGLFVWKDSFVYVVQCEEFYCLPGPKRKILGLNFTKAKCHKTGKIYILPLCAEAADAPDGAWTEFWRPRPGFSQPQRKIAYMRRVPGKPYQVVAEIYNDARTLKELYRISNAD
jgi:hypothetical protein